MIERLWRRAAAWALPSDALTWYWLDGYLPRAPAGFAWYGLPVTRPARPDERYRYTRVRRGRTSGHVRCQVTIGWRWKLGVYPPTVPAGSGGRL